MTNPSNYCRTALPNVLCKVIEKMVNLRLLNCFDQKGTLPILQCGGSAKQTTSDLNSSLKATVRKAQAKSEHVMSIFFNMAKTYNLTLRHDILMDINEAGKERIILNFIQNFLKPRYFKV